METNNLTGRKGGYTDGDKRGIYAIPGVQDILPYRGKEDGE